MAWLVLAVGLSVVGFGVAGTLSPSVTVVPGTQSLRAQQLANAQFGPTQLVPILLEGPKQQLDRQGPKLVAALSTRSQTRVPDRIARAGGGAARDGRGRDQHDGRIR